MTMSSLKKKFSKSSRPTKIALGALAAFALAGLGGGSYMLMKGRGDSAAVTDTSDWRRPQEEPRRTYESQPRAEGQPQSGFGSFGDRDPGPRSWDGKPKNADERPKADKASGKKSPPKFAKGKKSKKYAKGKGKKKHHKSFAKGKKKHHKSFAKGKGKKHGKKLAHKGKGKGKAKSSAAMHQKAKKAKQAKAAKPSQDVAQGP